MENERLGLLLMKKRLEAGWSRNYLAQRLGVTEEILISWEMGQAVPEDSLLPKIIKVLRISLEEFKEHIKTIKYPTTR